MGEDHLVFISFAKGEYRTPQGKIYVEWKYEEGKYHFAARADKDVKFSYDFGDREVLSLDVKEGVLNAVIK